jgi:hypothetical protein
MAFPKIYDVLTQMSANTNAYAKVSYCTAYYAFAFDAYCKDASKLLHKPAISTRAFLCFFKINCCAAPVIPDTATLQN